MESSRSFRIIGAKRSVPPEADQAQNVRPWRPDLKMLGAGFLLAQVFVVQGCSWVAWFLSSLVHELGHTIAGILCGMPSFPAIRLDGHAVTMHGEFSVGCAVLATLALGGAAWQLRDRRTAAIALAAAIPVQLWFAFVAGQQTFFLLAGHLGEIAFATVFLARSLDHGDDEGTPIGCLLEATFGMYLVCHNAVLFAGLATSQKAVLEYMSNGSFGLENDLLRVVGGTMGSSLTALAWAMLVPTIAAPAIAVWIARHRD